MSEILRQKFQNFEPEPPMHIWENIEKSLDAKKGFFIGSVKYYAAAILILALIPIAYFGFYSNSGNTNLSDYNQQEVSNNQLVVEKEKAEDKITKILVEKETVSDEKETVSDDKETINNVEPIDKKIKSPAAEESNNNAEAFLTKGSETNKVENLELMKLEEGFMVQSNDFKVESLNSLSITSIYSISYGDPYSKSSDVFKGFSMDTKTNNGHWENTIFISPEFSLTNLDSVSILNSYSIGVEPSRYFNENWFVRFGLNISVTGDKGFAKIDYISNEFMGTYDDVYDVTFDTIDGIITPNYHTKTVEIWDSIRHISVSEVTNRYLFAQVPALLGYKNKLGKLNWYVFGGPAIGFQIAKWIDEPIVDGENIEIIDLNNTLPLRSTINYQIWVGAGIEYKLGGNSSIVIEPLFKHYFKSLYSETGYKVNTSGFALRIGYNYKIGY